MEPEGMIRDSSQQGALAGAVLAASGLKNSAIIIHASCGCAWVARWMRSDHALSNYTPVIATSLLEHEIIFGGAEKLRRTIEWVLKRWKPKQLFILNADSGSLINDPVEEIIAEAQRKWANPIIFLDSPHFLGLEATGVDQVFWNILQKFSQKERKKEESSVNIIAPFLMGSNNWVYDLAEIQRLIRCLNLDINCVLTHNTDVKEVERFHDAQIDLYLTYEELPKLAQYEEEHGLKRVGQDLPLPIGIANTERWFLGLASFFQKKELAQKVLEEERKIFTPLKFHYNCTWLQTWLSSKYCAVIGPASWAASLATCLYFDFSVFPAIIALYGESRESMERAKNILRAMQPYYEPIILENPLYFTLAQTIEDSEIEFSIGQTQEKSLVEGLGVPHLSLAGIYSIYGSFNFLPDPSMGYRGMLYLLTMFGRLLEDTFHEKERWKTLRFKPDKKWM